MDVTAEVKTEIVQPKGLIRAEQRDKEVLILSHFDRIKRFDKKIASYRLEHRWLSDYNDVHAVQGNDYTFWQKKELNQVGAFNNDKSLFDCFNLFT